MKNVDLGIWNARKNNKLFFRLEKDGDAIWSGTIPLSGGRLFFDRRKLPFEMGKMNRKNHELIGPEELIKW